MSQKKETIIFAEDDLSTTKVLLYLLTRDGYQVYPYSNGVGVLDGVKEHRPDLIILDIMMPVKDGLTVLQEIRSVPEISNTPVILLTATKDENSVTKSIEFGVADFIIKPFKLNDLSIRVKKIISLAQNKSKPAAQVKQSPEEHFRNMLDSVPVLIWESGIDKQCTFFNKTWLDFTGRSLDNELGNGWTESIFKEDFTRVLESYYTAFDSRKPFKLEFRLKHNSGDYKWVLYNGTPRFSSESAFLGYTGSCFDISEQHKSQTELNKLSQAVMQSPASIIITDAKGIIEFVNPKYSELTGFSLNETVGKLAEILKKGSMNEEEFNQFRDNVRAGLQWKGEILSTKKNGEKFWESLSISPIKNQQGKITNFIAIKEDINVKKQMFNDLLSSKEKAEELNRLKSNFLSNMSHELRTPLVGIIGFAEILMAELQDSAHLAMVESLFKSGKRLSNTLNALLDLSDSEAKKIEVNLTKTDITEIVENLLTPFYAIAKTKNLTLKMVIKNTGNYANLDENLFIPVINNLLNNAIKFTKHGGVIVEVGKKSVGEKNFVYLTISDTGIGILPESLNIIFEEFRQGSEGLGRNYEGTGLGLTISKKFTELMHGTITVDSEYGAGSAFIVTFPAI